MVSDELGLENGQGQGEGGNGSAGGKGGWDQEAFNQALDGALQDSLGPLVREMGGAVRQVSDRLSKLEEGGHRSKEGDDGDQLKDTVKELLEDPEKAVGKWAEKALEKRGQGGEATTQAVSNQLIANLAQDIDNTFGEGTWKEHFAKEMGEVVKRLPGQLKVDRDTLAAGVAAIKGDKFKELSSLLTEKAKKEQAEEIELAKRGYTRLPAGRMPAEPKNELTQEEKEMLGKLNAAGANISEEQYLREKDIGPTIDDWLAVQPKKQAKEA